MQGSIPRPDESTPAGGREESTNWDVTWWCSRGRVERGETRIAFHVVLGMSRGAGADAGHKQHEPIHAVRRCHTRSCTVCTPVEAGREHLSQHQGRFHPRQLAPGPATREVHQGQRPQQKLTNQGTAGMKSLSLSY